MRGAQSGCELGVDERELGADVRVVGHRTQSGSSSTRRPLARGRRAPARRSHCAARPLRTVGDSLRAREPATAEGRGPHGRRCSDFCRATRGARQPRSSGKLGVEVVRVVDAVERSLASGGERVDVALPAVADVPAAG